MSDRAMMCKCGRATYISHYGPDADNVERCMGCRKPHAECDCEPWKLAVKEIGYPFYHGERQENRTGDYIS